MVNDFLAFRNAVSRFNVQDEPQVLFPDDRKRRLENHFGRVIQRPLDVLPRYGGSVPRAGIARNVVNGDDVARFPVRIIAQNRVDAGRPGRHGLLGFNRFVRLADRPIGLFDRLIPKLVRVIVPLGEVIKVSEALGPVVILRPIGTVGPDEFRQIGTENPTGFLGRDLQVKPAIFRNGLELNVAVQRKLVRISAEADHQSAGRLMVGDVSVRLSRTHKSSGHLALSSLWLGSPKPYLRVK